MSTEFNSRVTLVTGGSRGIGRATCIALARQGARVAINYVNDKAAALDTLTRVREVGGDGAIFQASVDQEPAVHKMIGTITTELGPIDFLVTNAGIAVQEHHSELNLASFQRMMTTNVEGTFIPIMAVKDGMIERGSGGIVCVASVAGLRPRPLNIAYSTSKAAVVAMARNFAAALGPNVRVNCVAPGLIETDMIAGMDHDSRDVTRQEAFVKRLGRPEDIAEAIVFLLSDKASFVSGQTFVADGGRITLP
jgi:3-oxoacyl-[acyl-carrier protein] reductase